MKIVFSSQAQADLTRFVKFIAEDKPQAARRWADAVRKSLLKLSNFPRIGRVVPEFGDDTIREIIKGQYRIIYKIDEGRDTIVIVTIHHSRRLLR